MHFPIYPTVLSPLCAPFVCDGKGLYFQKPKSVTVLQKSLSFCCVYLSICNIPAKPKDPITRNGPFNELPLWGVRKSYKLRAGWENLVWDLPRLAGAGLHCQQGEAAHFAHRPLESRPPPEATQRTPAGEGDRRPDSLPATPRYTGKKGECGGLLFTGGAGVRDLAPHRSWAGKGRVMCRVETHTPCFRKEGKYLNR